MSSRQSKEQARRNGALAAGTKSPEGIKRSSMNALRHGLTAKSLVLNTESQEQFDELLNQYVEFYGPANTVELDLVDDMVAARWRLQRTRSLETVTLNQRMVDREADKLKRRIFPGRPASLMRYLIWLTAASRWTSCCVMKPAAAPSTVPKKPSKKCRKHARNQQHPKNCETNRAQAQWSQPPPPNRNQQRPPTKITKRPHRRNHRTRMTKQTASIPARH